jgi:hypothetical protein
MRRCIRAPRVFIAKEDISNSIAARRRMISIRAAAPSEKLGWRFE